MEKDNNKPLNCWEFWKCNNSERKKCAASETISGRDCYNLTANFQPPGKRDFQYCWECPWYRKISTTFNIGNK